MKRLDNKVALITGGSSGIGKHVALEFANEGAVVVIGDLNEELGREVVEQISSTGRQADFVLLDVTSEEKWQQAIATVKEQYGKLDILVNSAGISVSKNIEDSTLADMKKSMALNVEGPFLGMQQAIKVMKETGGSIINLGSMAGLLGLSKATPYSTSKGALRLLSKSVAVHCAKKGYKIRVNTVNPSYVRTPMLESVYSDEQIAGLKQLIPIGELGNLSDVSNAIIYLASDESAYVTGIDLNIEGGLSAGL